MPRRKLSEYRSKMLVHEALDLPYTGWELQSGDSTAHIKGFDSYVVKVDQAVKGRYKKGLVLLDVKSDQVESVLKQLTAEQYDHFIVEPYIQHATADERYLSMVTDRSGCRLSYSNTGGIDIEAHPESIKTVELNDATDWKSLSADMAVDSERIKSLWRLFTDNYFVFLEINPYVSNANEGLQILDAAIEVDDAGIYFTQGWSEQDLRNPKMSTSTESEAVVHALDASSPASFNLSVLNPNGSVFLLLSGGGASVVIADEVFNRGFGDKLANYGEYSGNPTAHEAYIYTAEVIKLLLASSSPKKVLFVGGAVANFTDIASTFAGVIKALSEYADQLSEQKVKVFVRRGGPRQEIGLAKMKLALEQYNLYGGVYDPTTSITDALGSALKEVA